MVRKRSLNVLGIFKDFLATIGHPIYYLVSKIFITTAFVLYVVGHVSVNFLDRISKIASKPKPKKKKVKAKKALKPAKLGALMRLEKLRIVLFELKVVFWLKAQVKKFLTFSKRQIRKVKPKFRLSFPIVFLAFIFLTFYLFILRGLPSPKLLQERQPQVSTKIYDRNGNLLYKIYKDKNRTIVPLTQIPQNARLATLAAEDAEFYSHAGFSVKGILRAFFQNVKTGSLQGGSTITQQLVKNTLLSPEKTITRKIKEIILSVEVEATYSKDKILEMYLNEVSYGGTSYGIEEASEEYFGKKVENLNLAEAALLAGLPRSPTLYSPFGQNPSLAFERQREVLRLMVINKYISKSQEEEAKNQSITFVPNKTEIKAPHFVMYVRQLLVNEYGEDMVEKGGLEVTTSLDLTIQEAAEKIVKDEVSRLGGLNVGNGAALVIDPGTGEILAMVGSKDYFDLARDGNVNVTTSIRSPGSSIKVVNYSYALSNGYTPASIIDDSPITYVTPGTTPYSPKNYDGQFRGNISLRSAFGQSRNIPAVKVLASYGVTKMIEQGQKMGITTWTDPSNYGISLTLGGGGVTALDLAKVYSTVANYGKRPDFLPILEVKNYKGRVLEKNLANTTQVLDERVAFLLTDILKDNNARAPEFGSNSYLVVKNHPEVAVKTGTSNDLRDNWTVGYSENYLVLTWVGNNDNSPMSRVASGVTGASPIWNKIMTTILADKPSIDWQVPQGVSKVNICSLTGTLPCNNCPTRQEWFLNESKPNKYCTIEQVEKILNPQVLPGGQSILDSGASSVNR